jgi:hypothetical protein
MDDKKAARALQWVGTAILLAAIGGFATIGIAAAVGHAFKGEVPACCVVMLLVGFGLAKPELLQDDTQQASTMRVGVLVLIAVFALLTTKAGWGADGLSALTLDGSWAWVLGAALGGKALQSFSEYKWPGRPSVVVPSVPSDVPAKTKDGGGGPTQPPTKIDSTGGPAKRPKA